MSDADDLAYEERKELAIWEYKGEEIFEESHALAILLDDEHILIGSKSDDPYHIRLFVNCSDVFAWGCSEWEPIARADLQDLYRHWLKDDRWGPSVWCIKKRKIMPQKPVADEIKKAGIWDLDEYDLEPNPIELRNNDAA